MSGIHDLPLFLISSLLLNITPGADTLYIVARSAAQGSRAGMVATLGTAMGCNVHIFGAALGLSALLAASATAFTAVKLIGGAYLVYMGISLCRDTSKLPADTLAVEPVSLPRIFGQGFLTDVLNPKVALFFLAFLPQFIEPSAPDKALAFVMLGLIFNVSGTIWCFFLAWTTAYLGGRMALGRRLAAWLSRAAGGIFVALGIKLVVDPA
ncbi:LysE family translocator [Methylococcus sp. EFPC2]|uniref:LysE family translocator n=1 Tax=Methylococcus sp. EFPC2 TaxID=2812648 RepID=UPI0019686F03|nr:LysE family translocator [Methylococcus sp. EFPC2]QSA98424.1 LysE family translocator [Methylococcus sp. EFPC2]